MLCYELGRPDPDRFGLTVHTSGKHQLWLDDPVNQVNPQPKVPQA